MNPNSPISGFFTIETITVPDEIIYTGRGIQHLIGTDTDGDDHNMYPGVTLGLRVEPRIITEPGEQEIIIYFRQDSFDKWIETTATITAVNPTPVSFELITKALNNVYYVNSVFDRAGASFKVTYDSGDVRIVGMGQVFASPLDLTTVGTQTITYTYTEEGVALTATETVEVIDNPVVSVFVFKYPALIFAYGETPTVNVIAVRESGKVEEAFDVPAQPTTIEVGTKQITVTYDGFTTTWDITAVRPMLGTTYVAPGVDNGEVIIPLADAGNNVVYDPTHEEMFPYTVE